MKMMHGKPLCSIVIPCKNEEKEITKCLDAIFLNDYPKENLEIIIVDGMSEDNTIRVITEYSNNWSDRNIRVINNIDKTTPVGINLGIRHSNGSVVAIVGAHNFISDNFLSRAIGYIAEDKADCAGGKAVCIPSNDTMIATAISFAFNSKFGVGNSFRTANVPRYADGAASPIYKKEVFDRIGFFDEDLLRNQDDEFNLRLIRNGGRVLLEPDIVSHYRARASLFKLWRMYYQYGYFKPLVAKKLKSVLTVRQLMPVTFIGSLLFFGILSLAISQLQPLFFLICFLYLFANVAFSLSIALKRGLKYFLVMPTVFATLHFSYGLGYLKGILDFLILNRDKKRKIKDLPLTR